MSVRHLTLPVQVAQAPPARFNTTIRFAAFCVLLAFTPIAREASAQVVLTNLEQQAQIAFNPANKMYTSLVIKGTVTWDQGALHDSGTVDLRASIDGSTSETWALGTVPYSFTSTAFSTGRSCKSTNAKGVTSRDKSIRCLRATPWFAPEMNIGLMSGGLSMLTKATSVSAGPASLNQEIYVAGVGADGFSSAGGLGELTALTATRISYDDSTFLPLQVDWDDSIDSGVTHVIPYRVVFSDYRPEQGLVVPHRIQRYVQRTLQADITVTSVTVE